MSEAYLYWIHLPEHKDPKCEGYIGVSNNPKERFRKHKNKKLNPHLANAFDKYRDRIVRTILLKLDEEFCYEVEKRYRPTENIGWNIAIGGSRPPSYMNIGKPRSDITKRKISESKKGKYLKENNHLYKRPRTQEIRDKISKSKLGKPFSEEHKKKLRSSAKGKTISDETKLKLSDAMKGKNMGAENPWYGKKHSAEAIEKIRQAAIEQAKKRKKYVSA